MYLCLYDFSDIAKKEVVNSNACKYIAFFKLSLCPFFPISKRFLFPT